MLFWVAYTDSIFGHYQCIWAFELDIVKKYCLGRQLPRFWVHSRYELETHVSDTLSVTRSRRFFCPVGLCTLDAVEHSGQKWEWRENRPARSRQKKANSALHERKEQQFTTEHFMTGCPRRKTNSIWRHNRQMDRINNWICKERI